MNPKDAYNIYGKIPPQATDVEEVVLGALMLERNAYYSVCDLLKPESFYKESHQIIFQTIQELIRQSKPIDLLMVTQELKARNMLDTVGGPVYITELTSKVASAGHILHHSRIIAQKAIAREIIRITSEKMYQAYDENNDIDEILTGLQDDLIKIQEIGIERESTIGDAVRKIEERIKRNQTQTGLTGIGTGLYKLDQFTGGLQKSDLIIIAGETSQGKTSLALTILKNAVLKHKARVAVYSLEMSDEQLTSRILAQEANISSKEILNKTLSNETIDRIKRAGKSFSDLPVFFDESSTSTIDQICTSIRRLKIKHGINLVVVDYLQLVGSGLKNKTDERELAEISRRLKNIAKELNIPIIALSQFSRDKNSPRPSKSRLRGSGQIEEAADVILLIWRPSEFGLMEFPEPFKGVLSKGLAECIIAKGRNIGTGAFLLKFNPETTGFYDYAPEFENQANNYNPNRTIEPTEKDAPF